ncbi:MAG: hypothetical protein HC880_05065 [Bacteroidia bacterium]|nr:hypothetical protein [Bacteroidia bacterium]
MKKLMLFGASLLFAAQLANAQSGTTPAQEQTNQIVVMVEDEKVEITMEELPEEVKNSFNQGEYAEWETGKIYKVVEKESQAVKHYEIEVVDAQGQTQSLKFLADGNLVQE